jgi:glycosyltransferase involved in cell wall biosynthesis
MHIVMLSDMETQGGAAIAASRLALALCRAGHRVTRVVTLADGRQHHWTTVVATTLPPIHVRAIRRLLPSAWRDTLNRQLCRSNVCQVIADLRPDVINIHNIHSASRSGWFVDLVRDCADRALTVWTLHDMWSFTGRCAYNYDCQKFIMGCDAACPTLTEYPELEAGRITWAWQQRKLMMADQPQLMAVTPSHWLQRVAKSGLWAGHQIEVIPNGLPLDVYRPLDKRLAQTALGIETSGPTILAAAQDWSERRKGGKILLEALEQISCRPFTLLTLGVGQLPFVAEGVRVYPLDYIDHERTRVLVYNAADVFVHPAPVDNFPNVVIEAFACGTPVLGFPIGGVPEMVRPYKTGWLANELSSQALAVALEAVLDEVKHGVNLSDSCRAVAETEYGDDLQARRYLSLFQRHDKKP